MTEVVSLQLARAARDDAIVQVDEAADDAWKLAARRALWQTIKRVGVGGLFTTDDIDCYAPREPRAWGPVMLRAARAGLIENTHRVKQSHEVACHARPKALWLVVALTPAQRP